MRTHLQKGFTLIEAILYVAIFGILLTALLGASVTLVQSSGQGNTIAMLSEEGNFLLNKLSYELSNATLVDAPLLGQSGNSLTVQADMFTAGPLRDGLYITQGLTQPQMLNNSNTWISGLWFYHEAADDSAPESVGVHFTLHARSGTGRVLSQDFYATTTLTY